MLAKIRLREGGEGQWLKKAVDLLRFSEEDIRERLVVTGFAYDSELVVMGFEDWNVEYAMSLHEAYMLKTVLEGYYDSNEFVICHMLKRRVPVMDIVLKHYRFLCKNEVEAMKKLLKNCDVEQLIDYFFVVGNTVNLIQSYVDEGYLLNTQNGFYILHE